MMMHSHRFVWNSLVLLLVLVVGSACGQAPAAAPTDPTALEKTDVTMRFQWIPQWQFAGYIVAKQKGYYDELGLNVTLNGGGPEFPTKALVASGAEDFGTAWVDSMYTSRIQGVNLVALATLLQANPSAYMVHADSGIRTPNDFEGRTVAVYYGGGVETEYLAMLRNTNTDRSKIKEVPGEFNLEPFLSRRVDVWPVYATDQPNTVRNMGYDIDLIFARDYGVVMQGDVLFATQEFIAKHPNTVRAFVHASLRGWEWAINNPEEAVQIILAYNPQLDADQLRFEAAETIPLLRYGAGARCVGYNDPDAWARQEQLLREMGRLTEPIPFEAVANNTFVEEYYRAQGIDCAASAEQ